MRFILLAGLIATALPAAAQAVTYDAFASFNGTSSTAGQFEFGSIDYDPQTATTSFSLFGPSSCSLIPGTSCRGTLPGVYKANGTPTDPNSTVIVAPNALILHPGDGAFGSGVGQGSLSAILFNVPTTGTYNVSLSAVQSDTGPHTQTLYGVVFDSNYNFVFGLPLMTLTTGTPSFSFTGGAPLLGGMKFGVAIGNDNGSYYNDSTAVNFSLAGPVPEPASWAMMVGGFGLLGAAMRSSRRRIALT